MFMSFCTDSEQRNQMKESFIGNTAIEGGHTLHVQLHDCACYITIIS